MKIINYILFFIYLFFLQKAGTGTLGLPHAFALGKVFIRINNDKKPID